MNNPIVESQTGVTLIAGGPVSARDLAAACALAPLVVAADGGGDRALALGVRPQAVIGDMDSLSAAGRAALAEVIHPIAEQDSTDFDKALRHIAAPFVLGVGLLGGRVDHGLSALAVLSRRYLTPCLLIGREDVIFAAPKSLTLNMRDGDRFSLFPMAPTRGRSTGLHWPIDAIDFAPMGRGGTSNRANGVVTLEFDVPGMLVIVPRARLRAALDARITALAWAG
jgi:thiamine pyrophosphokinase